MITDRPVHMVMRGCGITVCTFSQCAVLSEIEATPKARSSTSALRPRTWRNERLLAWTFFFIFCLGEYANENSITAKLRLIEIAPR